METVCCPAEMECCIESRSAGRKEYGEVRDPQYLGQCPRFARAGCVVSLVYAFLHVGRCRQRALIADAIPSGWQGADLAQILAGEPKIPHCARVEPPIPPLTLMDHPHGHCSKCSHLDVSSVYREQLIREMVCGCMRL
jgi:hypothetical protein